MANKRLVVYFLIIILVMLVMLIAGCSMPGLNKDNASVARDIVLNDPAIKGDIASSGGSYSSEVQPADLNDTGYLNYSGNFYRVSIHTASRGLGGPYLEHFDMLVDTESNRVMQVGYRFDVAIYPEHILVPGHAAWYRRFPEPARLASSEMPWAYIEVNLSLLNASIRPVLMDEDNFNRLRQGMPFDAWSLYSLGENATEVDIDAYNTPVATGISGITVVPGRYVIPGSSVNGHGVKLMFKDSLRHYYFVLINDGPADVSVESMVMG